MKCNHLIHQFINMKFKLTQTKRLFTDYEEDEMNKLKNLGFVFKEYKGIDSLEYYKYIVSQNDIFIEINTLEELLELSEEFGELIITKEEIEIYNDYRE